MSAAAPYDLTICRDSDELAHKAAALIAQVASESIRRRGRFTLALAGGSTPKATYALLADPSKQFVIDWSRTFLFFGDERHVPADDERSNFRMARETLVAKVPLSTEQVFPVDTRFDTAAECAAEYGQTLAAFFATRPHAFPALDLILLGLGDDGHTASLFPGAAALSEVDKVVTWSPPGVLPPPVDRVTLTFPALNAAEQVAFLVAGAGKAPAVRDVLVGDANVHDRPAVGVRPKSGRLTWLVDAAAASLLER